MARKTRYHLEGAVESDSPLTPVHISKQDFGQRVRRLMYSKGWNQSELARRANLRRDAISTYIRGIAFPSPKSLHTLATALDVKPEDLLPNYVEQAIEADHPSIDFRVSPSRPNEAWLKIDQRVSTKTALEVMRLLDEDKLGEK